LEQLSNAPARVIRESARSVAFVQGAFALRHNESGRLLRHVVDAGGNPMRTPFGQPWIDPDGTGAIVEFQFTGTGFLIGAGDMIVTNRHIVRPWTIGARAQSFRESGLEPEILKLIAYLPGWGGALDISQNRVSETSDLAVFDIRDPPHDRTGLMFADAPSSAGDEVLVMGFPAGLRALLAQAGPAFLAEMEESRNGVAQFWDVARHLSERDLIWPLASRGIVAQANEETVAYDAETTVGGSGGPVLDLEGRVVAITAAILPEFGGSNIGVPVAQLRLLLESQNTH
jgi:S1-C subfamily serine protease